MDITRDHSVMPDWEEVSAMNQKRRQKGLFLMTILAFVMAFYGVRTTIAQAAEAGEAGNSADIGFYLESQGEDAPLKQRPNLVDDKNKVISLPQTNEGINKLPLILGCLLLLFVGSYFVAQSKRGNHCD